jgi:hypothetical protein
VKENDTEARNWNADETAKLVRGRTGFFPIAGRVKGLKLWWVSPASQHPEHLSFPVHLQMKIPFHGHARVRFTALTHSHLCLLRGDRNRLPTGKRWHNQLGEWLKRLFIYASWVGCRESNKGWELVTRRNPRLEGNLTRTWIELLLGENSLKEW